MGASLLAVAKSIYYDCYCGSFFRIMRLRFLVVYVVSSTKTLNFRCFVLRLFHVNESLLLVELKERKSCQTNTFDW